VTILRDTAVMVLSFALIVTVGMMVFQMRPAVTTSVSNGRSIGMARALERPLRGEGRIIAGVCAALADRFGVSRLLVRLVFIIFGIVGAGEIAYLLLWILIPRAKR
jgi:phage shock protein C